MIEDLGFFFVSYWIGRLVLKVFAPKIVVPPFRESEFRPQKRSIAYRNLPKSKQLYHTYRRGGIRYFYVDTVIVVGVAVLLASIALIVVYVILT